jgi:hypothetical protein
VSGSEISAKNPKIAYEIAGFWKTAHLQSYLPTIASKGVTAKGTKNSLTKAIAVCRRGDDFLYFSSVIILNFF